MHCVKSFNIESSLIIIKGDILLYYFKCA